MLQTSQSHRKQQPRQIELAKKNLQKNWRNRQFYSRKGKTIFTISFSFPLTYFLTKDVSYTHTGYEGGFRGWGQSDISWVSPMYEVSKNVFGKAVLSLVAEFQK